MKIYNNYIDFTDLCFTIAGQNEFRPTPVATLAKNLMAKELDLKLLSDVNPITKNVKDCISDLLGILRYEIQYVL